MGQCQPELAATEKKREEKRSGIALIVILGLMAMLMMLGVAFSISMRVERMGAGSFRFGVNSRHMVWAGLARAVDDIHRSIENGNGVYPDFDVLPSAGLGSVRIAFGDSALHVPGLLQEKVRNTSSGWITAATNSGGGVQGRVAYLVVNCSGFLDANHVAGTNRMAGNHPTEVIVSNLSEILDTGQFLHYRQNDKRYESLPDLFVCQTNYGLRADVYPGNFVAYSYDPGGYRDGANVYHDALDIGFKSAGELIPMQDEIVRRLRLAGIPAADAPFVFSNLLDYVNPDPVPRTLAGPNTLAVPMLNEMMITGSVLRVNSGHTARAQFNLDTEWFYPFVQTSPHDYTMHVKVESELTNITDPSVAAASNSYEGTYSSWFVKNADRERYDYIRWPKGAPRFRLDVDISSNDLVSLTVRVKARIERTTDSVFVDQIPAPDWEQDAGVEYRVPPVAGSTNFFDSREVIDPRFNWRTGDWRDPRNPPGSLPPMNASRGALNEYTQAYWRTATGRGIDTNTAMHIANRGHLVSVGELGNLLRNRSVTPNQGPWETIRLIGNPALLSRHFTVHPTNTVRRGTININSTNRQVLASAFVGMPWGYAENTNRLMTWSEAGDLADGIIQYRADGGVFTNAADLVNLPWQQIFPTNTILDIESAISYSYGLFGTRQHLFAIYVTAGPFAPGMGVTAQYGDQTGHWLGYQRALFFVWRDAFPDADGRHRVFVHDFQWLEGGD